MSTINIWTPKKNLARWVGFTRFFQFPVYFKKEEAIMLIFGKRIAIPKGAFVQKYELVKKLVN